MPVRGVKTPTGGTRRKSNLGSGDEERQEVAAEIGDNYLRTSDIASMHCLYSVATGLTFFQFLHFDLSV